MSTILPAGVLKPTKISWISIVDEHFDSMTQLGAYRYTQQK
jgi:hypothetical protein